MTGCLGMSVCVYSFERRLEAEDSHETNNDEPELLKPISNSGA